MSALRRRRRFSAGVAFAFRYGTRAEGGKKKKEKNASFVRGRRQETKAFALLQEKNNASFGHGVEAKLQQKIRALLTKL